MDLRLPASCADYRLLARKRLPRFLFDYIDGGANDELTLAANTCDFQHWHLRQRVLHDVSRLDTSCRLFGRAASLPLALAPLGMAGLYRRRGEVQAALAADACGVPFSLSSVGICSLAEIRAAGAGNCWFQLYMLRDRSAVLAMLEQAWALGCDTLLFTVDLAVPGIRRRDTRNGMLERSVRSRLLQAWQLARRPGWLFDVGLAGRPHRFGNLAEQVSDPDNLQAVRTWLDEQFDASVTWRDIDWLRQQWPGRLLIKGVLEVEDALQAAACGADGIVLSNHGGRQLDGAPSSIRQLPMVAAALDGRIPILLDGGIRSGTDLFKVLALGAQAALIGRPWAWALAAAGRGGVETLLRGIHDELRVAMALCGVSDLAQIGPHLLQDRSALAQLEAAEQLAKVGP